MSALSTDLPCRMWLREKWSQVARDERILESYLLWGLKHILGSCCWNDGSFVQPVRPQGKRQAGHQLHAQVHDGDTVIQDGHRLLSQDGVRERRQDLQGQRDTSVSAPHTIQNSWTGVSTTVFSQVSRHECTYGNCVWALRPCSVMLSKWRSFTNIILVHFLYFDSHHDDGTVFSKKTPNKPWFNLKAVTKNCPPGYQAPKSNIFPTTNILVWKWQNCGKTLKDWCSAISPCTYSFQWAVRCPLRAINHHCVGCCIIIG